MRPPPAPQRAPSIGNSIARINWKQEEHRLERFIGRLRALAASTTDLYRPTTDYGKAFLTTFPHILRLLVKVKKFSTTLTRTNTGCNLNLPSLQTKGVIYAVVFHSRNIHKIYVGQTSNSAFERYKQHIDAALSNTPRDPRSLYAAIKAQADPKHHREPQSLRSAACKNVFIIPLQQVPTVDGLNFKDAADMLEFAWIQRLSALSRHNGFNLQLPKAKPNRMVFNVAQTAHFDSYTYLLSYYSGHSPFVTGAQNTLSTGQPMDGLQPNHYAHHSLFRDYRRRIRSLAKHYEDHQKDATVLQRHLGERSGGMFISTLHLSRMNWLLNRTPFDINYGAPDDKQFSEDTISAVKMAIFVTLCSRILHDTEPTPPANTQFTYQYKSQAMDAANLAGIFNDPSIHALLPAAARHLQTLVTAKHRQPLRSSALTHNKYGRDLTYNDILDLRYGVDSCDCGRCHQSFCPDGHPHVITADLSLLQNPRLEAMLSLGMSHRAAFIKKFTPLVRAQHLQHLKECLDTFYSRLSQKHGIHEILFDAHRNAVLHAVAKNLDNLADGTNLIPPDAPLLYKDFEADLATAHQRWIFTVTDKLPNTLILICKYYYAYLIIHDIYARNPITNQPVFTPTHDAIADVITDYHFVSTSWYSYSWLPPQTQTPSPSPNPPPTRATTAAAAAAAAAATADATASPTRAAAAAATTPSSIHSSSKSLSNTRPS